MNAVPYCPDRRLPGASRTVLRPFAASGPRLDQKGTPVQELFLERQRGLKAVPKGPPTLTGNVIPDDRRTNADHQGTLEPTWEPLTSRCSLPSVGAFTVRGQARAMVEHSATHASWRSVEGHCRDKSCPALADTRSHFTRGVDPRLRAPWSSSSEDGERRWCNDRLLELIVDTPSRPVRHCRTEEAQHHWHRSVELPPVVTLAQGAV